MSAIEESLFADLVKAGHGVGWARQYAAEEKFRRRGAAPAIKAVGGGGCSPLVPATDLHSASHVLHAPKDGEPACRKPHRKTIGK
jgi:hypothetical protein